MGSTGLTLACFLLSCALFRLSSGEDFTASECLSRFPLQVEHPTVIISGVGAQSFQSVKSKTSRISFLFQEPPVKMPIWIYNDNTWDEFHGRGKLQASMVPIPVCMIDVFKAEPWLYNISKNGGAIDKYYDFAGWSLQAMHYCSSAFVMNVGYHNDHGRLV